MTKRCEVISQYFNNNYRKKPVYLFFKYTQFLQSFLEIISYFPRDIFKIAFKFSGKFRKITLETFQQFVRIIFKISSECF